MRYRRGWIVLMLMGMLIIAYIDRVALSVAAHPIASYFALTPVSMGYLFSAFVWVYVIFLVPVSMWMDRFGTRVVAGAGLLLWSVATVLTGLSTNYTTLIFSRLLLGIGETTCFPAAGRVIRDWIPERERGQVSTLFNSGSSAGTAIGAPIAAALIGLADWRWTFIVLGGVGALCVLAWYVWFGRPEDVKWLSAAERDTILRQRTPLKGPANTAAPSLPEPPSNRIRDLLRMPSMWGLMLTQGGMVYTGYLFFSWLPSYLQSTLNLSMSKTGTFTAIPFIFAVVVGLLCARVCDRWLKPKSLAQGQRRYFIFGFMCLGLCILLARHVHDAWLLLLILSLVALANNMTTALNLALVNDLVDNPRDASRVVGLTVLGGNVCGLLSPIVTGYVVDRTHSFNPAFDVAAYVLIAGALGCLFLSKKRIQARRDGLGSTPIFHASVPMSE